MAIWNLYLCSVRCLSTIFVALTFFLRVSGLQTEHYSSSRAYGTLGYGYHELSAATTSAVPWIDTSAKNLNEFSRVSLSGLHREKRTTTKQNLCEGRCECKKNNHFLAVECNFNKNQVYIFGIKNFIPPDANSLVVKLAPRASLRIETNFFMKTKVNAISIVGDGENNEVHVEFGVNASTNSNAPFPEIEIKNCHTLVLRENAIGGEVKFDIKNCNEVIIFENAFYSTKFYGVIDDVRDLRIRKRAFYKAQGNLKIYKSYIENVYRFDAFFHQIGFFNCTIGNITEKTFDVIQISAIIFDNCRIKVINTEAMTEKLFGKNLKITGGHIGVIESQAIFGIGISELVLSNNQIDEIQSNAIKVTSVNASITNNEIRRVGLEWLQITDWTTVIVSNNKFGEFNLMLLHAKNNNSLKCIFEGNTIRRAMPGSLNFTNKSCMIRQVAFDHICKCLKLDNWLEKLTWRDIRSESYCSIDDNLKFCFNRTQLNVLEYENEVCSESSDTLDCMKQNNLKIIEREFIKPEDFENNTNSHLLYIIIVVAIVFILLIIVLIVVFRKTCIGRTVAQNFETETYQSTQSRFSKEDKRIVDRTLKMVKQNYPIETYEELETHVQDLLRDENNERQTVQTIDSILRIVGNCENPGDRFVEFTAVLNRLLQPTENHDPDPVYAEPNFQPSAPIYNQIPEEQTRVEHIYNEPLTGVQQPLLNNEYAIPADRSDVPTVYAEPFGINRANNLIPPYAAVARKPLPENNLNKFGSQKPSTSKNLPDVLNSSTNKKPMTNVQKLAENFANNPNFHITRSPTTNRYIPQYTISSKVRQPGPSQSNVDTNPSSLETSSNHSGSSDITVKIDDIDYVDA